MGPSTLLINTPNDYSVSRTDARRSHSLNGGKKMKKNLKKIAVLALALAMSVGMMSGCGSKSSSSSSSKSDTASKTSLVIAIDSDYNNLNPLTCSNTAESRTDDQIYDSLLRKDPNDTNKLLPRVAKSWDISKDGKCYTFHLRDDVTFQNGDKLTAKDVKWSFEQCAKSEYQGSTVDGFDHAEIVDDYTIKIYTSSVYAPFLSSLASLSLLDKAYYEKVGKDKFAQEPIGCGPYKWVSHDDGSKWVLEAYDKYYLGAPAIKKVTYKVIGDSSSMAVGLQTGEIDFADVSDASAYAQISKDKDVKVEKVNQTTFSFIAMNTQKKPYNNVKFRQAISYAVDRDAIVKSVAEGLGVANSNLLEKSRLGYSDSEKQYNYDPTKAKALLKEAGITGTYDLGTMYVAEKYKALAQVIQSELSDIGLTTKIEILEFNTYLSKLQKGDFGITCLQMDLNGDTQQVSLALTKQYIGMANNARWSDPKVEQWFKDAVQTIDESEREKIYEKIFSYVQEQAVYVSLYNPTLLYAHNANLTIPTIPNDGSYQIYDFAWK